MKRKEFGGLGRGLKGSVSYAPHALIRVILPLVKAFT
jgi:hypothetical protein